MIRFKNSRESSKYIPEHNIQKIFYIELLLDEQLTIRGKSESRIGATDKTGVAPAFPLDKQAS